MRAATAMLLVPLGYAAGIASASPWRQCESESETLAALTQSLLCVIEQLSDYRADAVPPPTVAFMPQHELEAKVCAEPCDVTAAYIPRLGVLLAANLEPWRDEFDRSALLHELVHHLQHGHEKFAALSECARERAKEQEAYALQNAYLAALKNPRRVTFYDGPSGC